ncbi:MAG: tetratricopeptide repeat protein [Nitrospirae bacterium]|nr:tetratricopeptide repeat protein [Nitrospirota bacterium]
MKKIVFVVLMVFALSAVYDTTFAAENSEYSKALKYYNSKKFKEAVELLKEQEQKNPTPSGYYLLGYALYKLGKFEEANEYFKEAYLLDPEFSLEKAGLIKKTPEAKPKEAEKPSVSETKEKQPDAKKEPVPSKEPQPQKPETAKDAKEKSATAAAEKKPSAQEPKKVEPQKVEPLKPMQPPAGFPTFPKPGKEMPGVSPQMLTAIFASFGIIILAIVAIWVVYYLLCLFLIAKKLAIPAPWTAWIPIVNLWTIVTCAGKPWWWILLLLIPIAGLFIYIYLWMCISENRGKSKWLGLLILIPTADLVLYGILAFSKGAEKTDMVEDMPQAE